MRRVRAVCLLLAVIAFSARPAIADPPKSCDGCSDFKVFCDGFCYEHGGALLCNYNVGSGCSDVCVCEDNEMYADTSGYCPPCNE